MELKKMIHHDLDYYQSGIRQLYMRQYQKYLFFLISCMLLTAIGIGSFDGIMRNFLIILFLLEGSAVGYVLRYIRQEAFESYFEQIKQQLPNEFSAMEAIEIQEDDQAYYLLDKQDFIIKLKKKNTRNFPSKIKQSTLLVGFSDALDKKKLEQPLHFFYYDITQIQHSENYKKELLKNTNFIAKSRKRKAKSAIVTIILLALIGTFIYISAKEYFYDDAGGFEDRSTIYSTTF